MEDVTAEVEEAQVVGIIREARRLIGRGWAQGYYAFDAEGGRVDPRSGCAERFCILGAISRAVHARGGDLGAYKRAARQVEGLCPLRYTSAALYNDAPGRTQEEVLALLDRAAGGK